MKKILRFLAALALAFINCQAIAETSRPNILWITGEDLSAKSLACYGNKQIKTPNFDKLAQEGFLYTHCFANIPVCAPARSSWIMGVHPVSSGTVYMRSLNATPESLVWYPDALRANGYFTANFHKTDYNTSNRKSPGFGGGKNRGTCGHFHETWDSYLNECWKDPNRKADQPFFQVNNAAGCHESYLHGVKNNSKTMDPAKMQLAVYHPDLLEIRMDYARLGYGIEEADRGLAKILGKLKADGHAEDTIVIYSSDHGGIIGRSKRFLYDSGTHSALIIRIPVKFKHLWPAEKPGTKITRLVSFLDMTKTWLAITDSKIPETMQGRIFLGEKSEPAPENVFTARDRMDEAPNMQRAIRDQKYLYIRNYEPYRPDGQYLEYLWLAPSMKAWDAAHREGKTNAITGAFFQPKNVEQLFDCEQDPDNVNNLAPLPAHSDRIIKMRAELKKQQIFYADCGFLPEGILMHRANRHKKTIYEMIRDPKIYDQTHYMEVADLANFAKLTDLPKLISLMKSDDEGERFWGVNACVQLGKQAAQPEVITIMQNLIMTGVKDDATLEIRVGAAYYLAQIEEQKKLALTSLAEVVSNASDQSPGKGRAWANLLLLGTGASEIIELLKGTKLNAPNQKMLDILKDRIEITL